MGPLRTSCGRVVLLLATALAASVLPARFALAQGKTSAATAAQAPQARAAELFNTSAEAYRRGDFQRAVTLLLEARSLDPQPVLLYNLGRAYEGLGNIDAAIDAFTRYLDEDPRAADRGAIEQRIGTLKRQRDERVALEKQRDAERARADEEKAARERSRQATIAPPPARSIGPYVLGGVGLAGVASGVVFGVVASSKHDNAASASTAQQTAIDEQDAAKSLATVSTISFVVGGALVAAGVTWWLIDGRARPNQGARSSALRFGLARGQLMLEQVFP
ncbi:hypothetical protein BH11MYX4_BH11MYX4_67910 [soil metagenome]